MLSVIERVKFVDAGGNWEGVRCSACGADVGEWWSNAMDVAFASQFTSLAARAPCCSADANLNDLQYGWAVGFGRFVLEAENPPVPELTGEQLRFLEGLWHYGRCKYVTLLLCFVGYFFQHWHIEFSDDATGNP